jgi:hypothetical protein
MAKPKTTKQHLIDKLILGQLPLHKRHGRMSQYGGNGEREPKLENAFTSIEFDTANLTIDEQCELRAKFFLEMVGTYIEQMEDKLQQTVATCVFRQLVAEGGQYIEMSYSPKQLRGDKKEQYGSIENYRLILEKNYKQVAFENQVSKMFSSIMQSVPKDSIELLTDSELNIYCRVVYEGINNCYSTNGQRENKVDEIFISGPSITPEEYSELQKIYNTKIKIKNFLIFYKLEMVAQSLIDEIQARYEPDKAFYNGYFGEKIYNRINNVLKKYYKEMPIDNIEFTLSEDSHIEQVDSMKFISPDSPDAPHIKAEQQQLLSLIQECLSQLTPQENKLLELKVSGATHAEIVATINRDVLLEQIKKGEVKPLKTSNIQYSLKKLEERLEKLLHSKGILSADELLQLSRRNKKPSVNKTDDNLKEEENNG